MPTVHWPGPIVLPPDFDDAGAPDPLLCPITQCLMTEPALVVSSGRTYERAAIVRWISEHGTDPLDRETSLNIASLAPNLAVRQMVETWARERNGGVLPNQDVRGTSEVVDHPPIAIANRVDADNININDDSSHENTAVRTNASLATRPFAGEDDPIVDGTRHRLGPLQISGSAAFGRWQILPLLIRAAREGTTWPAVGSPREPRGCRDERQGRRGRHAHRPQSKDKQRSRVHVFRRRGRS